MLYGKLEDGNSMVMTTEPTEGGDPADRIEQLLSGRNVEAAAELLRAMHPADQADLYDRLDDSERETMLGFQRAGSLFGPSIGVQSITTVWIDISL